MRRREKTAIAAVLIAGIATGATSAAMASTGGPAGGDEGETVLTGADLERASAVALASTGGGRVTATEVGDEDSQYEVEVTLDDGTEIDVQLDASFAVVESAGDTDPAE